MPYISNETRQKFNNLSEHCPEIATKGELEYVIFWMMKKYMQDKPQKYTELHNCVYAAQHCSDEFRRRFLDVREKMAMFENGDIEILK